MVDDGYVKLSDFGVAKILPNIEDCRSTSGTHGYMVSVFPFEVFNDIHTSRYLCLYRHQNCTLEIISTALQQTGSPLELRCMSLSQVDDLLKCLDCRHSDP